MFFDALKGVHVLQFVFFSLTVLFTLLMIGNTTDDVTIIHFVDWTGLICDAGAVYLTMGGVLNEQLGRTVLPIGGPH